MADYAKVKRERFREKYRRDMAFVKSTFTYAIVSIVLVLVIGMIGVILLVFVSKEKTDAWAIVGCVFFIAFSLFASIWSLCEAIYCNKLVRVLKEIDISNTCGEIFYFTCLKVRIKRDGGRGRAPLRFITLYGEVNGEKRKLYYVIQNWDLAEKKKKTLRERLLNRKFRVIAYENTPFLYKICTDDFSSEQVAF